MENNTRWNYTYFSEELGIYIELSITEQENCEAFKNLFKTHKNTLFAIFKLGIMVFVTNNPKGALAETLNLKNKIQTSSQTLVLESSSEFQDKIYPVLVEHKQNRLFGKRHKLGPISPIDIIFLMSFKYKDPYIFNKQKEGIIGKLSQLNHFENSFIIKEQKIPDNYPIVLTIVVLSFLIQKFVPSIFKKLLTLSGGSNNFGNSETNAFNENTNLDNKRITLTKNQKIRLACIGILLIIVIILSIYIGYKTYISNKLAEESFNEGFKLQKEKIMSALKKIDTHIFIHSQLGDEKNLKKYLRMLYKLTQTDEDLKIPKIFKSPIDGS